jgi:hypothetical protein
LRKSEKRTSKRRQQLLPAGERLEASRYSPQSARRQSKQLQHVEPSRLPPPPPLLPLISHHSSLDSASTVLLQANLNDILALCGGRKHQPPRRLLREEGDEWSLRVAGGKRSLSGAARTVVEISMVAASAEVAVEAVLLQAVPPLASSQPPSSTSTLPTPTEATAAPAQSTAAPVW